MIIILNVFETQRIYNYNIKRGDNNNARITKAKNYSIFVGYHHKYPSAKVKTFSP
jgi:hypothetical protein